MILKVLIILLGMCSFAQAESFYYFSGPNCAPCVTFYKNIIQDKEVTALIRKFNSAFKVDTEKHQNITRYYGVMSIPTVVIVQREEKYINKPFPGSQSRAGIARTHEIKVIARWPIEGVNFTDKAAFIVLLKKSLKTQADNQTKDVPDVIRMRF